MNLYCSQNKFQTTAWAIRIFHSLASDTASILTIANSHAYSLLLYIYCIRQVIKLNYNGLASCLRIRYNKFPEDRDYAKFLFTIACSTKDSIWIGVS